MYISPACWGLRSTISVTATNPGGDMMRIGLWCLFFIVAGCSKVQSVVTAAAAPKVGEYVADDRIWHWLQQGAAVCFDYHSDDTCQMVQYPDGVGKDKGLLRAVISNNAATLKIVRTINISLAADGMICSTTTQAEVDSLSLHEAGDMRARIGAADTLWSDEEAQRAIGTIARQLRQYIGRTTCYRYLITRVGADGLISEVQLHEFVDSIRQAQSHDPLLSFFPRAIAEKNLLLRPRAL